MPAEIKLHRFKEADIGTGYVLFQIDPITEKVVTHSIERSPEDLAKKVAIIANKEITGVAVDTAQEEERPYYVGKVKSMQHFQVSQLSPKEEFDFWVAYFSAPTV